MGMNKRLDYPILLAGVKELVKRDDDFEADRVQSAKDAVWPCPGLCNDG